MVGASVMARSTTPDPSLRRRGISFVHGGEPKDHEVCARNASEIRTLPVFGQITKTEMSSKILGTSAWLGAFLHLGNGVLS